MFSLSKEGIVVITRGDSASTLLFINKGTDLAPMRYELGDNDELYFALMSSNQTFENALSVKIYTKDNANEYGDTEITFEPKDTEFLIPGKYYYQIKLKTTKEDGTYTVNTVVPTTEFYIED